MRAQSSSSKPLLLALETSGDICSVAVLRGVDLQSEHTFRHEMHLSESLVRHLDTVLSEASAVLDAVDLFVVGVGPGSFTGTRIGVMTAKTFAVVRNLAVMGIGALEGMAAAYSGLSDTVVVPLLPCRTGVVYAQAFLVAGEDPTPLDDPVAWTLSELATHLLALPQRHLLLCGEALARYETDLRVQLEDQGATLSFGLVRFPLASQMARLAMVRRRSGVPADDPITLVPRYISPPPITQPKVPLPVSDNSEEMPGE